MSQPVIRAIDGRHVVGLTVNGIEFRAMAEFRTPREAVDFVNELEREALDYAAELEASRSASEVARQGIDEGQASGADQDVSGRPTTPAVAASPLTAAAGPTAD